MRVGLVSVVLVSAACATTAPVEKPADGPPEAAPLAVAEPPPPDLERVIAETPRTEGPEQTRALTNLAHQAETAWRYDLAAKLYEELVMRTEREGDERALADRVFDLARLHREVGLYEKARSEAARARVLYEKLLGRDAQQLAGVLQVEAFCEVMLDGDFTRAESSARRALALVERTGNPLEIASALNNLAAFARFTGKAVEAERRYREALRRYEDANALDTAGAATTAHNLAGLLLARVGSSPEVSALEELAERAATHALGPRHPFTIEILESLSNIYKLQHRGVRSMEAHERAARARGATSSWCVNSKGTEGCFAECSPALHCARGLQCVSLSEVRLAGGAAQSACLPTCPTVGSGQGCAPGWVCSPLQRGELAPSGGVCAPR